MVTTKTLHVKAAAFDKLAERLAAKVERKMESGLLDEGLAAVLRKHGWRCEPPAAAPSARAARKGRK